MGEKFGSLGQRCDTDKRLRDEDQTQAHFCRSRRQGFCCSSEFEGSAFRGLQWRGQVGPSHCCYVVRPSRLALRRTPVKCKHHYSIRLGGDPKDTQHFVYLLLQTPFLASLSSIITDFENDLALRVAGTQLRKCRFELFQRPHAVHQRPTIAALNRLANRFTLFILLIGRTFE